MQAVGYTVDKRGCEGNQVATGTQCSQEEAVATDRLEGQREKERFRLQSSGSPGRHITRAGMSSGSWSYGGNEKRKQNSGVFSFTL